MNRPLALLVACLAAGNAMGEESAVEAHAQATYIRQLKPAMPAAYSGTNSLRPAREWGYTFTSTLFLGARLGETELYFNPEFVQGVPLSGLHGLGGFTNGEQQRTAGPEISGYRARLFARHTWNLGGTWEEQGSDANQVKTRYAAERVVLNVGNFSVLDVFDAMDYSRDPRTQFMNWSSMTYGAWDFPADARGYTWGAAIEYIHPEFQVRAGRFLVPVESNGLRLDPAFVHRYGDVAEVEKPYRLAGLPAVARALLFRNRVSAGAFEDALALSRASPAAPDLAAVRHAQSKAGAGFETQIALREDIGGYVRAAWNDGKTETFMFTEIDRSLAAGLLAKGARWRRPNDQAGLAFYANGLSRSHRDYLAAGGQGFFLGDGRLNYAAEKILETYYSLGLGKSMAFSVDYQRVQDPGYNRDRGPTSVLSFRLHAEI